jgi:hypothetical protein
VYKVSIDFTALDLSQNDIKTILTAFGKEDEYELDMNLDEISLEFTNKDDAFNYSKSIIDNEFPITITNIC